MSVSVLCVCARLCPLRVCSGKMLVALPFLSSSLIQAEERDCVTFLHQVIRRARAGTKEQRREMANEKEREYL